VCFTFDVRVVAVDIVLDFICFHVADPRTVQAPEWGGNTVLVKPSVPVSEDISSVFVLSQSVVSTNTTPSGFR
jgi:hypothetical protein